MTTIHKSIEIDVPPEQVMDVLTDPERLVEFGTGVTSVDEVNMTEGITGSSFRVTYSAMGVPFHLRFQVTDFESSSRIRSTIHGGMSGSFDWTLTPTAAGTDVAVDIDYQIPGGPLGRAVDRVMIERMNEKNASRMLENLKMISEAQPAPQPS